MMLDKTKLGSPGIVISILLGALSVSVFYATGSYPEPMIPGDPGPALIPRLLAGIIFALAVLLFVSTLRESKTESHPFRWRIVKKPLATLFLIVVFVAVVGYWDTFILLPILLACVMLLMGERKVLPLIAIPILLDVFMYVIFYRIFHIMLPTVYF